MPFVGSAFGNFGGPAAGDLVILLCHCDALSLVNEAPYSITTAASYGIDTTVKKFGTGSLYFPSGAGGQHIVDYSGEAGGGIECTNGAITVEFEFRREGGSGPIDGTDLWASNVFVEFSSGAWIDFYIWKYVGGRGNHAGLYVALDDGDVGYDELYADDFTLDDSDFHPCAVTINGTAAKLFLDGVTIASSTLSAQIATGDRVSAIYFGQVENTERLDEIRVTLNTARYTGDYTPATAAFTYP